jgi:hypothetical protein
LINSVNVYMTLGEGVGSKEMAINDLKKVK